MVGHKTKAIYRRYAIFDAGALGDAASKIDRDAAQSRAQRSKALPPLTTGPLSLPNYFWCRGAESNCRHRDFQFLRHHVLPSKSPFSPMLADHSLGWSWTRCDR